MNWWMAWVFIVAAYVFGYIGGAKRVQDFVFQTERKRYSNTGYCQRCKLSWRLVDPHVTPLNEAGRGMFPLCEGCWQATKRPWRRMSYYHALYKSWGETTNPTWDEVEAAVKKESQ